MNLVQRLFVRASVATLAALIGHAAFAQGEFPNKPIRIINPYAAGGVVDILARALSKKMAQSMNVPFVVESKPGGGGNIGTDHVAQSPANGYTWLIATTSNAANMALMPNIRTDLQTAFVPVAQFAYSPNYFVVPASLPVSSVAEYVALAKAQPGKLSYGSAGIGSTPHLGFELFKHVAGINVVAVSYKGAPPIVPDLLLGLLSATYMPAPIAIAQAKGGRAKVLAVVNDTRTKDFPNVPTIAEAGFPKAVVAPWFAVMVPAGTPPEVVARIQREIKEAVAAPDVIARMGTAGAVSLYRPGTEVARRVQDEIVSWRALVKATGMKAE
ncbi:tripartite tricarboxylate transporter substrate binding protein [Hydrogenophaga sp. 2FB]|uniref:Bug family tripartite tricarboxylate transporter substrate binding protein n=1 Tax=Hydrogenophaga sp. 2FB TaxID=2502187 RepID=UPI0010F99B7D|nr:tripartite tricarboxylate transporter substrate binding protein [Hydrogenophaga sp. 2FB]